MSRRIGLFWNGGCCAASILKEDYLLILKNACLFGLISNEFSFKCTYSAGSLNFF